MKYLTIGSMFDSLRKRLKNSYNSDHLHTSKKARIDGFDEKYKMHQTMIAIQNNEQETISDVDSDEEMGRWNLLDGNVLSRVFHFLRDDLKSIFRAALTCKHWQSALKGYLDISREVDFCALGTKCSDSIILKIMSDYKKEEITSLISSGTGITASALEEIILSSPSLASVDIRGSQLEDLVCKFTNIYASDHGIETRLSKLNKQSLGSGSDATDDCDKSSDASMADITSTALHSESNSKSPLEGVISETRNEADFSPESGLDSFPCMREWGACMTKENVVPPVTRKYEVIDHYVIVADEEEVRRKMQVSLSEIHSEKLNVRRSGAVVSDMEIPEAEAFKPTKSLGYEVIEQEVYGIDPCTRSLFLDSMPKDSDLSLLDKHIFIEEVFLCTLNKHARIFTGTENPPMTCDLKCVFKKILKTALKNGDRTTLRLCRGVLTAMVDRPKEKYVAYRKGLGVICNKDGGFTKDEFIVELLGEVYPTWKWFEKQDGIRALQGNNNDPAPEFYNIYLERPKDDADGYDLVVVDAMHKANYASRICHSCRPNCEARVTAVDGQYQIGIYSVRPIAYGEEITFDYNSVTESNDEYENSVCLCGTSDCRGSYLNLTGEGAFEQVLKKRHGLLNRCSLLLEACKLNSVSKEDFTELGKAGLGCCLLGGLPAWLIAYSARLVRFIKFERMKLPAEILRYNIEEKKRYFTEIDLEAEKKDAEIQAEGVYNQRIQNLAITIHKVKYVMRCLFDDPKEAPPPLERLSPEAVVSHLWEGEGSFVDELLRSMAPRVSRKRLKNLKTMIHARGSFGPYLQETKFQNSLKWLRDVVRKLRSTYERRHDAAGDLIHLYAHTNCFLRLRKYEKVVSPPIHITSQDLSPKYAAKLGSGVHEYRKTYSESYCIGQLMFWYIQNPDPDVLLAEASRGCLSLPVVSSFYAKSKKPSQQLVYGRRAVKCMLSMMKRRPQMPWPEDRIWSFKSSLDIVGSPMLDAVLDKARVNKPMRRWLRRRSKVSRGRWGSRRISS
ncbi:histone-lysine N-methyltransferase ATXR3-like isoform X2 [Andrographis paniculata]|uniref:histone-lysine N-methyltransferase ATXR3-like isoform X2 n=1 Tax=Andrographis paniculata TaxID=175694 RepID=UPI0021E854C4|nr:histone-lysine N-methyltransferase ATXR3-like isoform X2 [Andrographis paniculata]